MTDRELLELAAKAAGVAGKWTDNHIEYDYQYDCSFDPVSGIVQEGEIWNPLRDDGDALRLAVKLRLTVRVWVSAVIVDDNNGNRLAHEDTGCRAQEYEYEATRRAIVRAAAAIGEGMK